LTVKEAAKSAGIKIPGLCDHPNLKQEAEGRA
jgi:NADH dehydrogenase/NADH:ubiquinone oxidoreductase subunit G